MIPTRDISDVFIELTSKCNMDCKFCPYCVLERKKEDMQHEHVLKILEELKGCTFDVTFHVLGEPFLNKHFVEYLDICDAYDIHYWVVTNGLLLSSKHCKTLFSHKNLKLVEVSLHTPSDRTMQLRGTHISFECYLEKIKTAVFSKERFRAGTALRLDVMYDKHLYYGTLWNAFSEEEWFSFQNMMEVWGRELEHCFPEAMALYPNFYTGKKKIFSRGDHYLYRRRKDIPAELFNDLPPHITWINWEIFPNFFVTLKKFFLFSPNKNYLQHIFGETTKISVKPALKFDQCGLSKSVVILSNGDITFCCLDYEGELACGNIENMSIAEAAASEQRKKLLSAPYSFKYCRDCKGQLSFE